MIGLKVITSNKSDKWATPKWLYDQLNYEFNFNFDPCPLEYQFNGLQIPWGKRVFVNPPYSNIEGFIKKAIFEIDLGRTEIAVFLVPARTDVKWFHEYIYKKTEIRFIKGRLRFSGSKHNAPFPSMIVIFKSKQESK